MPGEHDSKAEIYNMIDENIRKLQKTQGVTIYDKIEKTISDRGGVFKWNDDKSMNACFTLQRDENGKLYKETLTETMTRLMDGGSTNQKIVDGLYNLVKDGNFFFQQEGFDKPFSLGLAQGSDDEFYAYLPGSYRHPEPPEKPSGIKAFFHFFGFFKEDFQQYEENLKAYNNYEQNQPDFEKFNEDDLVNRKKAEQEAKAEKQSEDREQARKEFYGRFKDVDKTIESRFAEGEKLFKIPEEQRTAEQKLMLLTLDRRGRSGGHVEKLETLVKSNPVYVARFSRMLETVKEVAKNESTMLSDVDYSVNKYFGDSEELSAAIPVDGVQTMAETKKYLSALTKLANSAYSKDEFGSSSVELNPEETEYLKDMCKKNIGILNGALDKAGIGDDMKFTSKSPNIEGVVMTAAEIRTRAEITGRVAGRLAVLYPKDSPEYNTLAAMEMRAAGISSFCGDCLYMDGADKEQFSVSDGIRRHEGASDRYNKNMTGEKKEAFNKAMEEVRSERPEPEYQTLRKNAGKLSAEEGQRLAADIVVASMKDTLPKGVYPRDVAEQLAERKDFKSLVGSDAAKMAEMAKSGDLVKSTVNMFVQKPVPAAQLSQPQAPQQTMQMDKPPEMGR